MKQEEGSSREEDGPSSEEGVSEGEEASRLSATRLEVEALWAMLGGPPRRERRDDDLQPPAE